MIFLFLCWLLFKKPKNKIAFFGKPKQIKVSSSGFKQPKPQWVKNEIIRLKALMPDAGVRTIADVFNRRYKFSRQMTVGKTFVYYTIKNNQYEVKVIQRKIKHKKPKPVPHNLIWAMDLTGKTDDRKNTHSIFSIIEHQSRACLVLESVTSKTSINLLRTLLNIIEKYGTPKIIRTDNEAIFRSRLFNFGLWFLGIKHQYTEPHCPWQNGKVERFFGNLKNKLNQWTVADIQQLQSSLQIFKFWYNHIRPHQNLRGFTPAEIWAGKTNYPKGKPLWFDEWDGLLTGDYFHK